MKKRTYCALVLAFSMTLSACAERGNNGEDLPPNDPGISNSGAEAESSQEDPGQAIRDSVLEHLGRTPAASETSSDSPSETPSDKPSEISEVSFESVAIPGTPVQSDGGNLYIMSKADGKLAVYEDGGRASGRVLYDAGHGELSMAYHAVGGRVYLIVREYYDEHKGNLLHLLMIDPESGETSELEALTGVYFDEITVDLSAGDHGMLYLNYRTAPDGEEKHRTYSLKADGTTGTEEPGAPSPYNEEETLPEGISPYNIICRDGDNLVVERREYGDGQDPDGTYFDLMPLRGGETTAFFEYHDSEYETKDEYRTTIPAKDGLLLTFVDEAMMTTGVTFAPYAGGGGVELFRKPAGITIHDYNELEFADACGIIGNTLYYILPDENHLKQVYAMDINTKEETVLPGDVFADEKLKALGVYFAQDMREHYFRNDPDMQLLTRNTVSYPQLLGASDAVESINEVLRENAEEVLDMDDEEAQDRAYLEMLEGNGVYEEDMSELDPSEYISLMYMTTHDYGFSGIRYLSDSICTIAMYDYLYFGGAHGMHSTTYHNFDRETGKELELTDIIGTDKAEFETLLAEYLTDAIASGEIVSYDYDENSPRDEIMEFCTGIVEDYSSNLIFAMTDQGLWVEFPVYAIGPYVSGIQGVMLPYDELELKRR